MNFSDVATNLNPLAGKPAPKELLIDIAKLERAYFDIQPAIDDPHQLVSFGTSGHRGTPTNGTFNEAHILAIGQAVCDYRHSKAIEGPFFVGKDTHAASIWAEQTILEVLAANGIEAYYQENGGFTPTPVISHAILTHNSGRTSGLADGLVITPSHNPPSNGGIKYNPTNGGPAEADATQWIEARANELLRSGNKEIQRASYDAARGTATIHPYDFVHPYVNDLAAVIDMEAIRKSGIKIGVDPLGGASVPYWKPIQERYGIDLTVVNPKVDPTFSFMPVDHDGKIRMDCSSPYAMAGLVHLKDRFDIAFASDPDADRHGIVTRAGGLMNPNHYLAVAIRYLLGHRPEWSADAAVGKTLVSSSVIDAVVESLGRKLVEVPVGFKWFADGLFSGSICFGGEESAGASFLRRNGSVWTTDKDGMILDLLAAELLATTGKDPFDHYKEITGKFGEFFYTRVDVPADRTARERLKKIDPKMVKATEIAGEPILAVLSHTPKTNQPIGGLKLILKNGWIAVRPSGTEDKAKIYAESFKSEAHLWQIFEEGYQIAMRGQ
jgi:phosphoglucomutase